MQNQLSSVLNFRWVERRSSAGSPTFRKSSLKLKRGFDIAVVVTALVIFMPMFVMLAAILLALEGRPVFIRHSRVGQNGKLFPCLKFRTMVLNSDEVLRAHIALNSGAAKEWDETRKLKDDPRVTPLGHVFRKTSIDELPQLINVLRGEMSLVGPRPIVEDEVPYYGSYIDLYKQVRPGLTGSWQVSGRSDISYSRRVEMDADYVESWTFGRDLMILAKTVPAVMSSRGSY